MKKQKRCWSEYFSGTDTPIRRPRGGAWFACGVRNIPKLYRWLPQEAYESLKRYHEEKGRPLEEYKYEQVIPYQPTMVTMSHMVANEPEVMRVLAATETIAPAFSRPIQGLAELEELAQTLQQLLPLLECHFTVVALRDLARVTPNPLLRGAALYLCAAIYGDVRLWWDSEVQRITGLRLYLAFATHTRFRIIPRSVTATAWFERVARTAWNWAAERNSLLKLWSE